jgi:micrococcal nuclease
LVREGYAKAVTYPPDVKYADRFKEAQREAKANNRGLWGEC